MRSKMKVKKIIASDMDGTLIPYYTEKIPDGAFEIIEKLSKKGVLFVPASGRTIHSLKELFEPLNKNLSYLSENGAVVWHDNMDVVETPIPKELAKELVEHIYNTPGQEAYITTATKGYVIAKDKELGNYINNLFQPYCEIIESLDEIDGAPMKVTAIMEEKKSNELFPKLHEKFGDRIHVMMAGPDVVDFCVADKGLGLQVLTDYYNLSPEDVYAFGDNYNDLSMLKFAGQSYMMETDDPIRRAAANHICTDVVKELNNIYNSID